MSTTFGFMLQEYLKYLIVLLCLYPSKPHSHYHTSFDETECDRPTPYTVRKLEANWHMWIHFWICQIKHLP